MKLLFLGNEHIEGDTLALEIARRMAKAGFSCVTCSSVEGLMDALEDGTVIIDVAKGVTNAVQVGIEDIKGRNIISLHDFDAGFFLKLVSEIGQLPNITVIAIPQYGSIEAVTDEVLSLLDFN